MSKEKASIPKVSIERLLKRGAIKKLQLWDSRGTKCICAASHAKNK